MVMRHLRRGITIYSFEIDENILTAISDRNPEKWENLLLVATFQLSQKRNPEQSHQIIILF